MELLKMEKKRTRKKIDVLKSHPCFSKKAHLALRALHLPVAPKCNIQCKHCIPEYDCANESRPGISSRVVTKHEALERVRTISDRNDRVSVVGIAGPGEPLANDETFEVLAAIHKEFPGIILCISTNGLYLTERIEDLLRAGVRSITITINALTHLIAEKIYSWASYRGRTYHGKEAAELVVANQQRGLINAIDTGFMVRVNTFYMPGINDAEIPLIAWFAGVKGADIHNILPLIPRAEMDSLKMPDFRMLEKMRTKCSPLSSR